MQQRLREDFNCLLAKSVFIDSLPLSPQAPPPFRGSAAQLCVHSFRK